MPEPESDELSREFIDFYDDVDTPVELLSETRYIDREFIAEGAIKNVYKVYDTHCSRSVALAQIKEDIFTLEQAVDFVREVQTTSLLEHSNIIRIYDIGITDGKPWFTMEFLSGRDLETYLTDNPSTPLFERLNIFSQLCDAISYAHANDILHLDLKPQNVNMGDYKQVILCDWGISSSTSKHSAGDLNRAQTTHGYIKGSPGYMAPEQAQANYQKDATADIYGLGALLYFILTGSSPIAGSTPDERFENAQKNRLKPFEHPGIPPRLAAVFQKALHSAPAQRYQSAHELKAEIENYLSGHALETESTSFFTQFGLFVRRNKIPSLIVGSLLLLLTVFTTFYISEITQEKNRTQVALAEAEDERETAKLAQSEADSARTIAEEALENYRQEQLALNEANNELADLLIDGNLLNLRSFQFEKALGSALASHEKKPTDLTRMRIAFSAFALQKFDIAAEYSKDSKQSRHQSIHRLALKYAHSPTPLPVEDCIKIYNSTESGFSNLPVYFLDQCSRKLPPSEFAEVLAHVLKKTNKRKSIHFEYTPESQTLDLSDNGNLQTSLQLVWSQQRKYEYNLLSLLPLKSLTIDDTPLNRRQSYSANMPKDFRIDYQGMKSAK